MTYVLCIEVEILSQFSVIWLAFWFPFIFLADAQTSFYVFYFGDFSFDSGKFPLFSARAFFSVETKFCKIMVLMYRFLAICGSWCSLFCAMSSWKSRFMIFHVCHFFHHLNRVLVHFRWFSELSYPISETNLCE